MMNAQRINWPTVALVGLAVAGMVATLAIVLTLTPESMLERLLELNWPAVATGAMTTVIVLYGMARRAGLVLPRDPSDGDRITPVGELDEVPTSPMGPRAMRRQSRPPGERSRRDGAVSPRLLATAIVVLAVAGLAAVLFSGCGSSAVRVHATIASTTGATVDEACQAAVETRDREQRAALAAHEYQEDAAAAVAAVRAHREPTLGACDAAKGIHDGWVEAITLGAAGAPFDSLDAIRRFAAPFLATWAGIARGTADTPHPLPPPPTELVQLADLLQAVTQ